MILINLLPQDLRKTETQKIVLPEIPVKKTLIISGLSVLGLLLLFTAVVGFFSWREASVKQQIDRLTTELQETRKIKAQAKISMEKLNDIKALTDKRFYWASLLSAVSESMTKGVWLRSLGLDEVMEEAPRRAAEPSKAASGSKPDATGDKKPERRLVLQTPTRVLKLEGSVTASGQETAFIGKYVKSLKENATFAELFRDIELSDINQRKIKEFDVYDFVLLCKFKRGKI